MWTLSAFIDEISTDFTSQCRLAAELDLRYVEVRSAWNANLLDLEPARIAVIGKTLLEHELAVSSLASPIGKIFIDEEFGPHLDRMRRAADVAHAVAAPYVRVFSFFLRPGADPAQHRGEVIERMGALTRIAEDADVVLVHENEKKIYGDVPSRCLDVVRSIDSPHLRLAWDPANFVQVGVRPYTDAYAALRPYLAYVQIKDVVAATGRLVTAGNGDGQIPPTLRALRSDGFDGFFSLEPHLAAATPFGGFSGPDLFRQAWHDFTDLLKAEGIEYA